MPTREKPKPGVKPIKVDPEQTIAEKVSSLAEQIAAKYEDTPTDKLSEALRTTQAKLREVQEEIDLADATLSDAMVKDEAEFAERGETGTFESKHFNKAREEVARLFPLRWRLMKKATELELAYRQRRDAELAPLVSEWGEKLEELRKKQGELEAEIAHAQGEYEAYRHERRDHLAPWKTLTMQFEDLQAGPDLSGMRRFLFGA